MIITPWHASVIYCIFINIVVVLGFRTLYSAKQKGTQMSDQKSEITKTTVALDAEDRAILKSLSVEMRTSDTDVIRRALRHLNEIINNQKIGIIPAQYDEFTDNFTMLKIFY